MGKDGNVIQVKLRDELIKTDKDLAKEEKLITTFRNVILEEDYFETFLRNIKKLETF